jgi:hypothetical protein
VYAAVHSASAAGEWFQLFNWQLSAFVSTTLLSLFDFARKCVRVVSVTIDGAGGLK